MNKKLALLFVFISLGILSCNQEKKPKPHYQYTPEYNTPAIKQLKLHILRQIPHKGKKRYTQGFEVYNGYLYESTGEYHNSSLRKIDMKTGDILMSKDIDDYFAEGMTIMNGYITQLSYKEGKTHSFNLNDFSDKKISFDYNTQGWGLTNNGKELIMSDGSDKIYYRDPITFKVDKTINVTYQGQPQVYINELEYVDGKIYANIYGVPKIIVINPETGVIESEVDASEIDCSKLPATDEEAVLNGIAYDAKTKTFYITGKRCPTIYEVVFE